MTELRSQIFRAFALPSVVLLGLANVGCPGNNSSSTTLGAAGGGGNAGGSTDGGGGNGNGGSGGAACTPGTEICDMKDNDCDGEIDNVAGLPNGCLCNDGEQQACYSGPDGTASVGACIEGTQDCTNGTWGACAGEIIPKAEECNLVDDDCNGAADDMGMASCGVGACAATVETCVDGQMQTCVPGQPMLEVCDGLDNNCNQLVDESDPMVDMGCMTGSAGVCAQGKTACLAGALVCVGDVMASDEMCDGLDNDCDGMTDNIPGTGGVCSTGQLGVCGPGTISCQLSGGMYQVDCFADVPASAEICDGLDNNCDGTVDDGNPEGGGMCDTGQLGLCQAGTLNCVNGAVTCTPDALASMEVCDGVDNNCDGQADEGNPGGGQGCGCAGAGITACQNGALVCNGGPVTYFSEDFSDNGAGWTLGTEWQIGPAVAGPAGACADPGTDTTPTTDNGIAGVIIGGCSTSSVSNTIHGMYYLTSPVINTAAAATVYVSFKRVLHSDYTPYMNNTVEVFNGSVWTIVWQSGSTGIHDTTWQSINHNITAYKATNMQIRWGFDIGSTGVFDEGSWSLDDVTVASATCP